MYKFYGKQGLVSIITPTKNSFMHSLARASGFMPYLFCETDRSKLIETMKQNFIDSLDLPHNPLNSTKNNYQAMDLKNSQEEVSREISKGNLSFDTIQYIATYLDVQIEILDEESKRMFLSKKKGRYLIRMYKDAIQYSLLGMLQDDKFMKFQFELMDL